MRSALVQTTMIGMPAELWVRTPEPSGSSVFEDREDVAGMGSAEGSV